MRRHVTNSAPVRDFDPSQYEVFRILPPEFHESAGDARLRFRLESADDDQGEAIAFEERIGFDAPVQPLDEAESRAVNGLLVLLSIAAGTSYFKAAAPPRIVIDAGTVAEDAMDWAADIYSAGLAEFAYRAGLPGIIQPEFEVDLVGSAEPVMFDDERMRRTLVPIGGGKDSIVSVEALREVGADVMQFAVKPNGIIRRVAERSGLPFVSATRVIDPTLLELNERGALNGHVPVTAVNSLIAVIQAMLLRRGPVVMSNESSASDPTLEWNGEPVNHQWSKSLEAEEALALAIEAQTGLSGVYFSLLRPFSELAIARRFAQSERYDDVFVSCNRAYRMGSNAAPSWCGECDKCRFVFLALSPYMSRDRLTRIFHRDLFDDESNVPGFDALLGLGDHKPFECVGEEAESTVAMSGAIRTGEWADTAIVRQLLTREPELAEGSEDLERSVFARSDALPAPTKILEKARNVIG